MLIRDALIEDAAVLAIAEKKTAQTPGLLVSRPDELRFADFTKKISELSTVGRYIVAEEDGRVIGHAFLDPLPLEAISHVFRLTIVVHLGFRSRGIGEALMRELIDWATRTPRVRKIELLAPLKAIFFPYDKSLFVLMGAPAIKRVQDLKGKVIGTTGPGATTEIAASIVLQNHGMDPKKDVTFMTIGGAETSITAMRNGIIQARAFNPDAAFIMKKQGFTELGVLADMGPWPWAGYSTSDAQLTNRRDKIKRWTRAMVKSLQLMIARKEETYKMAQAEFGHPRDVIEGAADVCIKAIDPQNPGGATDDAMRKNIDLTITQPLKLTTSPPLAQLVDFSVLREIHKELGIPGRK